ncbi:MAG: prophage tail fiber N-terminal domain-containing protein [Aeromonas veronii]
MGYRVSGTLKLPDGSPATNAEIEFISRKNFSPLVQELKSNIRCSTTGAYDATLEYGEYAVVVYPGGTYPAAIGIITLATDTVAGQDLPTLLQQAGWQPATPEYIQQISLWLAEANSSATNAAASASSAASTLANVVPKTRTVNGKALGADIALSAVDVGAVPAKEALIRLDDGIVSGWPNNTNGSPDNYINRSIIRLSDTHGMLSFFGDDTKSSYRLGVQSSNPSTNFTSVVGTFELNPYGGAVKINGHNAYHSGNIVGSGGIIEKGSNANGRYTKFIDGTLVVDNSGAPVATNPVTFIGAVTSVDSNKLRFGYWK